MVPSLVVCFQGIRVDEENVLPHHAPFVVCRKKVKMVLDRLIKFSVPVSMRPNINPGVKPLPNLPHRAAKPQYDRATHAIFAAAVRDMVQSQKGINLDRLAQLRNLLCYFQTYTYSYTTLVSVTRP